jgi:hypothetical protein
MSIFTRTVPNVMQHYGCSAEDAHRFIDLRDEGHSTEQAAIMAGLSDPPEDVCQHSSCATGQDSAPAPAFRVSVATLSASNGTSFVVCIDRGDRPLNAKPWDDGRITPYESKFVHRAVSEAKEWADFLRVPFTDSLLGGEDAVSPSPAHAGICEPETGEGQKP